MTVVITARTFKSCQLKISLGQIFLHFIISATKGQQREREVENPLLLLGTGWASWGTGTEAILCRPVSHRLYPRGRIRAKCSSGGTGGGNGGRDICRLSKLSQKDWQMCQSLFGRTPSSSGKACTGEQGKDPPPIHPFGMKYWNISNATQNMISRLFLIVCDSFLIILYLHISIC